MASQSATEEPVAQDDRPLGDSDDELDPDITAAYDKVERLERIERAKWLPPPIRSIVKRNRQQASVDASLKMFSRRDKESNQQTRPPDGEEIRLNAFWLVELYTPATIDELLKRLPLLNPRSNEPHRELDLAEWVRASRRRGGRSSRSLHMFVPKGSRSYWYTRRIQSDSVPDDIACIQPTLINLTSSLSVLVAGFFVEDSAAGAITKLIRQDASTTAKDKVGESYTILDVHATKAQAVMDWRRTMRVNAARWLAQEFPGAFTVWSPDHIPTIEFVTTNIALPWDVDSKPSQRSYVGPLGLDSALSVWECSTASSIRMVEGTGALAREDGHVLTMAARARDLLAEPPLGIKLIGDTATSVERAAYHIGSYMISGLAMRWAICCLLGELSGQIVELRDLSLRHSTSSAKGLDRMKDRLLGLDLECQMTVPEIKEYATSNRTWEYDFLDFTELPFRDRRKDEDSAQLSSSLRDTVVSKSKQIIQAESDLGRLLGVSGELTAAAQNLRLQRKVLWITVLSLITAIVATVIAILAFGQADSYDAVSRFAPRLR